MADGASVVLMSDCLNPVYGLAHADDLAAVLHALLSRRSRLHAARVNVPRPIGLLAQTRRGDGVAEKAFFAACERLGLATERLLVTAEDSKTVSLHAVRVAC